MAAKLLLLILVAGATAATLLVIRHERIDTAYEMSSVHRQAIERRRTLWALRSIIAEQCRPEEVRRLMGEMDVEWNVIMEVDRGDAGAHADADTDAGALAVASSRDPRD